MGEDQAGARRPPRRGWSESCCAAGGCCGRPGCGAGSKISATFCIEMAAKLQRVLVDWRSRCGHLAADRGGRTARGSSLPAQHNPASPGAGSDGVGASRLRELFQLLGLVLGNGYCGRRRLRRRRYLFGQRDAGVAATVAALRTEVGAVMGPAHVEIALPAHVLGELGAGPVTARRAHDGVHGVELCPSMERHRAGAGAARGGDPRYTPAAAQA